jgi:large subunit ribosomal protein L10
MPKESTIAAKQAVIDEIKGKLEKAQSMVIVNARGLTVEQDTALRRKLREAGVDYKVYKNTMVGFAVKDTGYEGVSEFLAGPGAFAFSYEDPMIAARLISKEVKAIPALEFKAGVIEGTIYDAEGIQAIADIPSREELLSKLLGSFKSPMASFARVINAIAEKQGEAAAE